MAIATIIQLKRDSAADWTSNNPTLASGRIGIESDTRKFKLGDGATAWTSLLYAGEFFDGLFTEAAAPSTPASGKVILYAKTDGLLYSKDDAGTETLVSGGVGGGGSGTVDFSTAYEGFTHFIYATFELGLTATGTGGTYGSSNTSGKHGAGYITTGTTASVNQHYVMWTNGGAIAWDAVGVKRVIWRVISLALPDATATGWIFIGAHRSNNTAGTNEAIMFRVVNNGNLECVTKRNGSETATDLGYRPSTGAATYEVRCNSGGTSVTFYIDGILVATHTTNIPGGAYHCAYAAQVVRTSATAQAINAYFDWLYVKLEHEAASYI